MADATTYVAKYVRANEPLNEEGSLSGWAELMSEDCTFEEYGSNRAEILKSLQQNVDDGWVAHNPIATAAAGEFLVGVYENRAADGSTVIGCGILRFGEDGHVVEIVGREPVEGQPGSTDAATHVGRWLHAVDAFNQGDVVTFGAVLADDCTFDITGGSPGGGLASAAHVGDTKAEIVKFIQQRRDDGWVSHNILGTAAAGEFLVSIFENRYADGTAGLGAGLARFNYEGQMTMLVGANPGA